MFQSNSIQSIYLGLLLWVAASVFIACEKDSPCNGFICENGGTCVIDADGEPSCDCPAEWTGTNCEIAYEACVELNCLNGGTCATDTLGNPFCECAVGFTGEFCEEIDICAALECPATASCEVTLVDGEETALCICNDGYEGDDCATEIRSKYLGTYNATSTCDDASEESYELSITANADKVTRMDFDNVGNLGLVFYGLVLESTSFVIPLQMDANGGIMKSVNIGQINGDGIIQIDYQYELGEDIIECTLELVP